MRGGSILERGGSKSFEMVPRRPNPQKGWLEMPSGGTILERGGSKSFEIAPRRPNPRKGWLEIALNATSDFGKKIVFVWVPSQVDKKKFRLTIDFYFGATV